MNGYLRQSTAAQVRSIGPFIDDGDFKTLENGLTIANTDIVISANGGADTTKNSGGATAHGAGGLYTLTWDATDSAAVGELFYSVKVAGALVHFGTYMVIEEALYDALMAASATGALPVSSGGITAASFAAGAIDAAAIATGAIDADAIAANAIGSSEIADGAITAAKFAAGAITATVIATDAIDADAMADGAITAATFAAGAITATVIANGAIDAATFAAGAIDATAIATGAIDADALATDAVAEIADGVWDEALAGHLSAGSTGEALSNAGSGASAADIADAVWDEATAGHTTSGTFGEQLKTDVDAILDDTDDIGVAGAGLTVLATQASVDDLPTNAELTAALGTADDATLAAIAALSIPTAVENADALLGRDMSAVAGAANRSPLNAMRFNRNRFTIVGGVLTVYEEDDVTPAWTATITQTAGDPVSASDPA